MSTPHENLGRDLEKAVERLQDEEYAANTEFNEWLDTDLVEVAGAEFKPSEILFYLDPALYAAEHVRWIAEESGRHDAAIRLLDLRDNRSNVNNLVDVARRGRVAPFVGAGCSIPCGKKGWKEFLLHLAPQSTLGLAGVQTMLDQEQYEEAAEALHTALTAPRFAYLLDGHFKRQPTDKFAGPLARLARLGNSCIVTTNFDNNLEFFFREHVRQPFENIMYGCQENGFIDRFLSGEQCLLKLHGNYADPGTHVFTSSQYDREYGPRGATDFRKPLPRVLRQIFVSHSLLFLGCGLNADRTLDLFRAVIASAEHSVPWHYAIVEEPATETKRQEKETMLTGLHIRPIWYPAGEHASVEHLLDYIIGRIEGKVDAL
jgi:hypothetical protein